MGGLLFGFEVGEGLASASGIEHGIETEGDFPFGLGEFVIEARAAFLLVLEGLKISELELAVGSARAGLGEGEMVAFHIRLSFSELLGDGLTDTQGMGVVLLGGLFFASAKGED